MFDERDFSVFDNEESKQYFKEILSLYYSQNYRAAIVMLYSFVVYDLFAKLKTMAEEGNKNAEQEIKSIENMMQDDEKYSKVEKKVLNYFNLNYSLYFNNYEDDIDYLTKCRNKCAHLKINEDQLFEPTDYQTRMLICSMYDHVLSIKAPFIMDLFRLVEDKVEEFSETPSYLQDSSKDELQNRIVNTYLTRMTSDSIERSLKSFLKLLFITDKPETKKNRFGLYVFTRAIIFYIIDSSRVSIFDTNTIEKIFKEIEVDRLKKDNGLLRILKSLIDEFSIVFDKIRLNDKVYEYLENEIETNPAFLDLYYKFYPTRKNSLFEYFLSHEKLQSPEEVSEIYEKLKNENNFDINIYTKTMMEKIPEFDGYRPADICMGFVKKHVGELSESIEELERIYLSKEQCTSRNKDPQDRAFFKEVKTSVKKSTTN